MKKTAFIAAAGLAALIASCTSSTPKADMKNDVDSLSYSIGMAQTQGLKPYLVNRLGVDTAYIAEFVKGLNEGANAGDDKRKVAYYAGINIGQQISQQMVKGVNYEVFGNDSTQTISLQNFMAGFIAGVTGKDGVMTLEQAQDVATKMMKEVKARSLEKTYGENKAAGEKFMAEIAKKPGIKKLDNGVYYEVITEGKGEIPADTSRVKVNYEGKLINDTIFDSSYRRNSPATFRCNQVIPGWTEALTHMPVGSTWMVYIPQEQGYAEREAGQIKPFSALKFKIELLSIEK